MAKRRPAQALIAEGNSRVKYETQGLVSKYDVELKISKKRKKYGETALATVKPMQLKQVGLTEDQINKGIK